MEKGKVIRGSVLLSMMLLGSILLAACQSTPAASPTAAPVAPTKAAAAPTTAPAAAPTAASAAPTAAAPAAATAAPAAAKVVTVKVGHMPTFTGANAVNGEPSGKAVNDYIQWVNDQGGLKYKDPKTGEAMAAKLDVMFEDTGYDATRALGIYQRQKAAGVKAIITLGGPIINTLSEPASKDKIPVLASGSHTDATLKPTPRYLMTSSMAYNRQLMVFVKYIKDNWKESRAPKLGLTFFDSPAGQAGVAGVPEYAKSIGWEVLNPEAIPEPATDTSIQVKRLLSGKPDYVYCTNTANAVSVMMKDAARLGLQGQTQWVIMGPAYDASTFQKVADAETNGVMSMIYTAMPTETNLPGVQMADAISQKYQKTPISNQTYMEQIAMASVMIQGGIKGALEKVGADALTGEAVRNAMFSMKNLDSGGLYPPANMSEEKPWIMSKGRLVQWKDHKNVILSDWQAGPE